MHIIIDCLRGLLSIIDLNHFFHRHHRGRTAALLGGAGGFSLEGGSEVEMQEDPMLAERQRVLRGAIRRRLKLAREERRRNESLLPSGISGMLVSIAK